MMSKAELEEIKKLNSKFDMIFEEFMKRNEAKCAPIENYPRRDEVIFKTYEIVRRMKFDNDMQIADKKIKEIDEQMANLEKEKNYRMAEIQDIERRFYNEY